MLIDAMLDPATDFAIRDVSANTWNRCDTTQP
jgi:hypothetical protein